MFHKVVWQHMKCVVEFVLTSLLQIYQEILEWIFFLNRLRFDRIMAMSLWPHFFGPPCMRSIRCRLLSSTFRGFCVCLSVCWTQLWTLQKRQNRSRCRSDVYSWGPRNHILGGSSDPAHWKGHFLEVVLLGHQICPGSTFAAYSQEPATFIRRQIACAVASR